MACGRKLKVLRQIGPLPERPEPMSEGQGGLDLALVHYPVRNKNGEKIGSAVTNLDVHDIARACKTFGVDRFYLVTPDRDQQEIVSEILKHWRQGYGAQYNSKRKEALELVEICDDLAELYRVVGLKRQGGFQVLSTGAAHGTGSISFKSIRRRLGQGEHFLLLFGTGWGLAAEVMETVDASLPAIAGWDGYNHLSVRSAAAIILDRLRGQPE